MTKINMVGFSLLTVSVLSLGYGIVRACTPGAIHSACDRCIEPPECSQTVYYKNEGLTDRAVGATCETCSTYYQGCDSAGTNSLGTSELWTQYFVAPYDPTNHTCALLAEPSGCPQYQGPPETTYITLESGCGELTGPAAGRPIQLPIFIKPPQEPDLPGSQDSR
jgi:hypothetical protein